MKSQSQQMQVPVVYHQLVYVRCAALIEDVMPEAGWRRRHGAWVLTDISMKRLGVSQTAKWIAKGEITLDICASFREEFIVFIWSSEPDDRALF